MSVEANFGRGKDQAPARASISANPLNAGMSNSPVEQMPNTGTQSQRADLRMSPRMVLLSEEEGKLAAQAARLYAQGLGVRRIGREIGVTTGKAYYLLREVGTQFRTPQQGINQYWKEPKPKSQFSEAAKESRREAYRRYIAERGSQREQYAPRDREQMARTLGEDASQILFYLHHELKMSPNRISVWIAENKGFTLNPARVVRWMEYAGVERIPMGRENSKNPRKQPIPEDSSA